MPGIFPTATARKVLKTESRTVSGTVQLPCGATDYGRVGLGATGPGWSASGYVSVFADGGQASFWSNGPESHVSGSYVGCSIQIGSAADSDDLDAAGSYPNYSLLGRGLSGDTISGAYSFSSIADLVLYTFGEDLPDGAIPDDQYPSYGGVRIVGEFPSNYGILVWEPHPGAELTGTATLGSATATVTAPSTSVTFSSAVSFSASVLHSPTGSGSTNLPTGVVEAVITVGGYPASGASASAHWGSQAGGEIGPGAARVWIDTWPGNPPPGETGGITAGGSIAPTKVGAMALDAMAMDHAYPGPVTWKVVKTYKSITDEVDSEGYHTIIWPAIPVVDELIGQSVSADIAQNYAALSVSMSNIDVLYPKSWDSGLKARGYINGVFVTYDYYKDERGRNMAWVVPPAGEQSNDWRVGFRGKAGGGLTISRASTLAVPLGSGTADGDDTIYSFGTPKIFEGYRLATATGDATKWKANGKTFDLAADLCFPGEGGPSVERQDTRFPLDAARRSTVETALWGLTQVSQIRAVGGSLSSLTLGGSGDVPKVHALACFVQWEQEVPPDELTTSGGDDYTVDHYCSRGIAAESSGRLALEIPHVRRQDNNAPGRAWVSDYFHLSCGTMTTLIGETPGWSATAVPDEWGEDPPAWFACQGYVRQGGTWTKQWEIGPGTIVAQPVYDGMDWVGDVGDVFNLAGGGTLQLMGRKIFRGSAYGPTKEETTVHYSDLPGGSATVYDQTTTGKRYFVGPTLSAPNDWGNVWVKSDHKASFGSYPRRIERGAFGVSFEARILGLDVSRSGRWARGFVQDGTVRLGFAGTFQLPEGFTDLDTEQEADWARVRYPRTGTTDPLFVLAGKDGTVTLYRLDSEDGTLTMSHTIGDGSAGELLAVADGPLFAWRLKDGTVYLRRYRRDETEIGTEQTTNLTGLDDGSFIAAGHYPDPRDGKRRIGLLHSVGGSLIVRLSDDGITFDS